MTEPSLHITEFPRAVPLPALPPSGGWRRRLIWVVPVLAALAGAGLGARALGGRGALITISLASAEGLQPGTTTIKHRGVQMGVVDSVQLDSAGPGVKVTARMNPAAGTLLVEDARFWVVRPRLSPAGVSGMDTLIGGVHLAMAAGRSRTPALDFQALETPPFVAERPGRTYSLRADNVRSLEVGAPVYLQGQRVGQTTRVGLGAEGQGVVEIFVEAPYHRQVTASSGFWLAGGLDLRLGAGGLEVDTQSIASLLMGGIAFETPAEARADKPAAEGREFTLWTDRAAALRAGSDPRGHYLLTFAEPVRGLEPGAPVELLGQRVGEVLAVQVRLPERRPGARPRTDVLVSMNLSPLLGAPAADETRPPPSNATGQGRQLMAQLVRQGLRARVASSNLFTGGKRVALDLLPRAPRVALDLDQQPVTLPTVEGDTDDLLAEVRRTFAGTTRLVDGLNRQVTPQMAALMAETRRTLASVQQSLASDGTLQHDVRGAMRDVSGAAQALRSLSEYLERHPESLIRGKRRD